MIDFIEYVVSELTSKRLSKANALSLIKQFTLNLSATEKASFIHPLLHVNTSDFVQQSYSSTFTGEEFFLSNHKVRHEAGGNSQPILPGVAYLEMAREAIEQAVPHDAFAVLEIQNNIWVRPILVDESKQVNISLSEHESEQIEYHIFSNENGEEILHCQGQALFVTDESDYHLDLNTLMARMREGTFSTVEIYAAFHSLGLEYGPAHQGIQNIFKGKQELLAHLRLPEAVAGSEGQYKLHPSLLDSALQASIGLAEDINEDTSPSLPFALERLRIIAQCESEMYTWIRYSADNIRGSSIIKLDIDICDENGNLCVQLLGFSSRKLETSDSSNLDASGVLLASPKWTEIKLDESKETKEFKEHRIIVCGQQDEYSNDRGINLTEANYAYIAIDENKNIADSYSDASTKIFELVKAILRSKPEHKVLIQCLFENTSDVGLFGGVSGLLKSATMENPNVVGQLVLSESQGKAGTIRGIEKLLLEKSYGLLDAFVIYKEEKRFTQHWVELAGDTQPTLVPYRDNGVYLITGGLGGLGILFVKEIVTVTSKSTIIVTGRSEITEEKQRLLDAISEAKSFDGVLVYQQLNLDDLDEVQLCLSGLVDIHKHLHGIIHSAGMIVDNFTIRKSSDEFKKVLSPKVSGTYNLDLASQSYDLDFFALFSSAVSATGNVGQADYAAANGFMDQFAFYRNTLVKKQLRTGHTVSINWPLWEKGGMTVDEDTKAFLSANTGMQPLLTESGMDSFRRCLQYGQHQVFVMEGMLDKMRLALWPGSSEKLSISTTPSITDVVSIKTKPEGNPDTSAQIDGEQDPKESAEITVDVDSIVEKTEEYLRVQFSEILKLPSHQIDSDAALERYGINSILAMNLTSQLEKTFGALSKTLFFEYQTIAELREYFVENYQSALEDLFKVSEQVKSKTKKSSAKQEIKASPTDNTPAKRLKSKKSWIRRHKEAGQTYSPLINDPIAVIGLSGRYPESDDIQAYWDNLEKGHDCIAEVPEQRWNWSDYYAEQGGKAEYHASKWGGFISGVNEFDPMFFNISPREAHHIDPQERLFLQYAWMAVEDAGYTRGALQIPREGGLSGQVGVYVGVMYGEYNLSGSLASIANRVSYVLNVHGPSMTLDTMCSSSLTAIHLACQDLKQGRTDLAVAGGVNISVHPSKYSMLSVGQFISSDGHCQSFGEGGDGYIPGEGVGAVILKRLSQAEADGDHIYGVIRGSVLNHGGKTNGYTVPNPNAQADVIRQALVETNIDARQISYIEAHGTGTKLGDPIEIAALTKAFQKDTKETGFCLIGSAKSNIGHCESAAGVAGLTKVLLQMKHKKIAPSLHSSKLNPNIDFPKTPFVVNQRLVDWQRPVIRGKEKSRIAGLSAFGAGGSNAHLVIEEYIQPLNSKLAKEFIEKNILLMVPLSARTQEQLFGKAKDLLNHIQSIESIDIVSLAYTLQVGREPMDERLGILVSSIEELIEKLQSFLSGEQGINNVFLGEVKANKETLSLFVADSYFEETLDKWISFKKFSKLIDLWVKGLNLNWEKLYKGATPLKSSLPSYPFAKDKYWVDPVQASLIHGSLNIQGGVSELHPVLHRNSSSFSEHSYTSTFRVGDKFVHSLDSSGTRVLSKSVYVEMIFAALAASSKANTLVGIQLSNIQFGEPNLVDGQSETTIAIFGEDIFETLDNNIEFEIYGQDSKVYCLCNASLNKVHSKGIDLIGLQSQGQTLIPVSNTNEQFTLNPETLDSIFQEIFAQMGSQSLELTHVSSLAIVAKPSEHMVAWVKNAASESSIDILLCDNDGGLCVSIEGVQFQASIVTDIETPQTHLLNQKIQLSDAIDKIVALPSLSKPEGVRLGSLSQPARENEQYVAKPMSVQLSGIQEIVEHKKVATRTKPEFESSPARENTTKVQGSIYEAQLRQELQESLAEALYMRTTDIDINRSFVDLGLDSIVGVEWVRSINKEYGLDISATRVYDYSTIVQLAEFVKIEMEGTSPVASSLSVVPEVTVEVAPTTKTELAKVTSKEVADNRISESELELTLQSSLARALYIETSDIEMDKSFVDLGLDSIVGVEWVKEINTTYGLELSATKVYDYSTIRQLAGFIATKINPNGFFSQHKSIPFADIDPIQKGLAQPVDTDITEAAIPLVQLKQELKSSLSEALYMPVAEIDMDKSFVDLGLDSIVGVEWVKEINKKYRLDISATRVYDYSNINKLAGFLETQVTIALEPITSPEKTIIAPLSNDVAIAAPLMDKDSLDLRVIQKVRLGKYPTLKRKTRVKINQAEQKGEPKSAGNQQDEKIAVIGMSGRYPDAENLEEYWSNLIAGKNSIKEIPLSRWDVNQYYDPDTTKLGKVYCKWLGLLDGAEYFDPLFFQISPSEAEMMDPQHRLFMQEGFRAFEDSGYSSSSLDNEKCGVYLGIMSNEYSFLLSKDNSSSVNATGNSFAIGAARIAYYLNLKGPAIPIDTACSSSLVALHLASQALKNHEIDMALAGGVSLYLAPESYLGMCQAGMLSPEGQCKTFDDSANGFVPGEGVGALVLKRLSDAEADNDNILGVILGSAINQDGKTNGITAPSVNSQIELERDFYNRYSIDPNTVNYVETHGTGTKLGDPIELEALGTVFMEKTERRNYCALGAVKSNIGHVSGAAGVASVQKVLLSMKHKTLAPTLNVKKENVHFDFEQSPFYISREAHSWSPSHGNKRRAAVSAFGFSGTNAHLVLEEYIPPRQQKHVTSRDVIVILSARNKEQLQQRSVDLLLFLRNDGKNELLLEEIAHTLQRGRDSMRERLAFICGSIAELEAKLLDFVEGRENASGVLRGNTSEVKQIMELFIDEGELQSNLDRWISENTLEKVASAWVKGAGVTWGNFYPSNLKKVSLPAYPFAKERYWIDVDTTQASSYQATNMKSSVATEISPPPRESKGKTYYTSQWVSRKLEYSNRSIEGRILLLNVHEKLCLEIAKHANTIDVQFGETFKQSRDDQFVIDYTDENSVENLIATLEDTGRFPSYLIHSPIEGGEVESLFFFVKAFAKRNLNNKLKAVSVFNGELSNTQQKKIAIGGFYKSVMAENPNFMGKVIDIRNMEGAAEAHDIAKHVTNELSENSWGSVEIRYDGERIAREFVQADQIKFNQNLPLKQKGSYVITGGFGGLGYIFAKHLVKNYNANLILLGRTALSGTNQNKLDELNQYSGCADYLKVDISSSTGAQDAVDYTKKKFSSINGVIHCAGVNKDAFIINKSLDDFTKVLLPKVQGTLNLDEATKNEDLDIFVLFSSGAGAFGNPGQTDYAYANSFLDFFAEYREALCLQKKRNGRTLSINWPFWIDGGMTVPESVLNATEQESGMCPLPTKEGVEYFEEFLSSHIYQGLALYGFPSKIHRYMSGEGDHKDEGLSATAVHNANATNLEEKALLYVRTVVGTEIKLNPDLIDPEERFESYGLDSIVVNRINAKFEMDLGELPKTLFYQYETVEELAGYLAQEATEALTNFYILKTAVAEPQTSEYVAGTIVSHAANKVSEAVVAETSGKIAIIGVHGRYPKSSNLDEYWENLKEGRDLIGLVPDNRWDYESFYDEDPDKAAEGKIYCKWGGFVEEFDQFDPRFFNISKTEAKSIDPQERLFLESVWSAFEDAGYTRESLKTQFPKGKSADVGVFVGVTSNTYQLLAPEEWSKGNNVVPGALPWSIANRVSYFFDFQGPSLPVDTACSSSLVAIHLACESLKKQECQVAVAGGINLYLHPFKYQSFCQRRMVATGAKNCSFGSGDDGFVPGEGVGTVVLKPLSKAIEDNDKIYGVIASSAFDHSGRSNGYSAPNPNSQANIIRHTMEKSNIHPETISYVEGHGTGTQLGDSLEITALTQAFSSQTKKRQFCSIGSVKANVGHSESAAGISGIAKILMQFKHRQLAPTIHSIETNSDIEFANTPFYLQHELSSWNSSDGQPRRALINSFGAGGVNACIVLEEFERKKVVTSEKESLIILSAKTEERLQRSVENLLDHLEKYSDVNLVELAYTLQVGREAMEERLACVATSLTELKYLLGRWIAGKPNLKIIRGKLDTRPKKNRGIKKKYNEHILEFIAQENLNELAQAWIFGASIDWGNLYNGRLPSKVSLPTYPFERERYWVSDGVPSGKIESKSTSSGVVRLHPLVSRNSSTLREVSFTSDISDTEYYAVDHKINGNRLFPGAGYLEMACVAGNIAGDDRVRTIRDIVWIQPLLLENGPAKLRTLLKPVGDSTEYEVVSLDEYGETVVHCEGRVQFTENKSIQSTPALSIDTLRGQYSKLSSAENYYQIFANNGVQYGNSFRPIQDVYSNHSTALARLVLADNLVDGFDEYVLHPSLIDGALQTVMVLIGDSDSGTPYLPFALDELEIFKPLSNNCYAYAEIDDDDGVGPADLKKFNIRILNEYGQLLVRMNHFYVRALTPSPSAGEASRKENLSA